MHYKLHTAFFEMSWSPVKVQKHVIMLLPFQAGCSKSVSKARAFLLHFKLPETRCKKTQALMGATRLASG